RSRTPRPRAAHAAHRHPPTRTPPRSISPSAGKSGPPGRRSRRDLQSVPSRTSGVLFDADQRGLKSGLTRIKLWKGADAASELGAGAEIQEHAHAVARGTEVVDQLYFMDANQLGDCLD